MEKAMQKPISMLSFDEWISDQIKAIAPYSRTAKPDYWYFAAGYDDVNVGFTRRIGGYPNHHFTTESLAAFYGATDCAFTTDFNIQLQFDSFDDVVKGKDGRWKPRKKGDFSA